MKISKPPISIWDKDWETDWRKICTYNDGQINMSQIKKELSDYLFLLDQIPKIYCHITGNLLSKTNYPFDVVIRCCDDHYDNKFKEIFEDFIDDNINDEELTEEEGKKLKKLFNEYI